MMLELTADLIRIGNYYLIYYVLKADLFASSTNSHLIITRYAILAMWVLFSSRKVIFWVNILILQETDDSPWNEDKQIPDRMKSIGENVGKKIKELKTIYEGYEKISKEMESKGQKNKKE